MAGSWGDHITLVAASEVYNVQVSPLSPFPLNFLWPHSFPLPLPFLHSFSHQIAIISNVDDHGSGQYITTIMPRSKKPTKTVYP